MVAEVEWAHCWIIKFAVCCCGPVGSSPITYARIFRKMEMPLLNQYESSKPPPLPHPSAEAERERPFSVSNYVTVLIQCSLHLFFFKQKASDFNQSSIKTSALTAARLGRHIMNSLPTRDSFRRSQIKPFLLPCFITTSSLNYIKY